MLKDPALNTAGALQLTDMTAPAAAADPQQVLLSCLAVIYGYTYLNLVYDVSSAAAIACLPCLCSAVHAPKGELMRVPSNPS